MPEPSSQLSRTSPRVRTTRPSEDRRGSYPDIGDDTGMEPDRESPPSTPRWVKTFGIIAIVLVLVFVGLHITGNAPLHMPSSGGTEHGMQAP